MTRIRRPGMSSLEKAELWRRWRVGETMKEIARGLGRDSSMVCDEVHEHSGFSPAVRCRSLKCLTLIEREEISRGLASGLSVREIARRLNREASTISREITRNGGAASYRAAEADTAAWQRARRPKDCKLSRYPELCRIVARKLALQWSPQQVAGWLEQEHPNDDTMRVSHEAIYRSLFIQARGVLKRELMAHLRSRRTIRRGKTATAHNGQGRGQIVDPVSIRERPAEIEDRAVPGHWEGDLLIGSKSQIATLVERQSRYTMLIKIGGRDTNTVVTALKKAVRRLPSNLRQSITWDRGLELSRHKDFTMATDTAVYFCDPSSPWQRGSNENTNGLLRQYFSTKTDFSKISQRQLNAVAQRLNQRPRKTLGYSTPANKLNSIVATTG